MTFLSLLNFSGMQSILHGSVNINLLVLYVQCPFIFSAIYILKFLYTHIHSIGVRVQKGTLELLNIFIKMQY